MEKAKTPVYKKSLFSWVFSGNIKLQVLLLAVVIVTVFARVLPLEMQKRIINEAINLRKIDLLFIYETHDPDAGLANRFVDGIAVQYFFCDLGHIDSEPGKCALFTAHVQ